MGKYGGPSKCTESSCELCSYLNSRPIDLERHGAKLVSVNVKVNDVCIGKKVAVACIIYDQYNRILAFKGFITMADRHNECVKDACGTIERKIVFVLPEDEECEPRHLKACTIANYIYPCEPNK
ncbi:hypothetical protein [Clostridium saccharoperbutylacetonicum]|uniref:hypothetical protein n=1 Tax=Clostridium saccharoperbutylacetonicum TaxID=36745 RepID=UPI0039E760B6